MPARLDSTRSRDSPLTSSPKGIFFHNYSSTFFCPFSGCHSFPTFFLWTRRGFFYTIITEGILSTISRSSYHIFRWSSLLLNREINLCVFPFSCPSFVLLCDCFFLLVVVSSGSPLQTFRQTSSLFYLFSFYPSLDLGTSLRPYGLCALNNRFRSICSIHSCPHDVSMSLPFLHVPGLGCYGCFAGAVIIVGGGPTQVRFLETKTPF